MKKEKVKKVKPHYLLRKTPNWVFISLGIFLGVMVLSGFLMTVDTSVTGYGIKEDTTGLINGVKDVVKVVAVILFGKGAGDAPGILSAKILIFLIILGVAYLSFSKIEFVEDYPGWGVFISAAFGILATRFLSASMVEDFLLVPSTTFTIAIVSILAFSILFYLIETWLPNVTTRRVAWIFVGILFLWMWYTLKEGLGKGPIVYALTGVAAGIMVIMEKRIAKARKRAGFMKEKGILSDDALSNFKTRYNELTKKLANQEITTRMFNQSVKRLNKSIDVVLKESGD